MKIVKWVAGIFVGLAVLGALLPSDKKDTQDPITQVAEKAGTDEATAKTKVKKVKKHDDNKTGVVGQKVTNAGTELPHHRGEDGGEARRLTNLVPVRRPTASS